MILDFIIRHNFQKYVNIIKVLSKRNFQNVHDYSWFFGLYVLY